MKVVLLVYEGCSFWGISGSIEILSVANKNYRRNSKRFFNNDFFELEIVSAGRKKFSMGTNLNFYCDKTINDEVNPDLIIISGIMDDFRIAIEKNQRMIEWLKKQYSRGVSIASYCTGLIFLAAAGLVDNKCATTHWAAEKYVRENFPKVKLQIWKTIVDEGNIYSCAGSSSYQNLLLYLIEKFMGRKYAINTSKIFLLDFNKDIQISYAMFNYQNEHQDHSISKIQILIEKKCHEKLTIEELSECAAMSQRNFIRRFKKATGENPGTYIQKVKIESAKKMLEKGNCYSIEEIAYKIGYEDINSFRSTFRKYTGLSPSDYKMKFNRWIEDEIEL